MSEEAAQKTKTISWQKIILTVLIILLVAGAIAAALFWYFCVRNSEEPTTATTTKTSTSSAKPDETASWKTYKGETIAVSFKIPSNFSVKDQKGGIQNTYFEGLITVSDEKGEARFAVINAGTGAMMAFLYKEDIIIDGVGGTKNYYTYYKDPSNTGLGPEDQIPKSGLISFTGKNFVISYAYSKENEELMKKVLPTFKFLD